MEVGGREITPEVRRRVGLPTIDDQPYRPGQRAKLNFRLTDAKGQPVQGALSLAAVDEAVFAVMRQRPGSLRPPLSEEQRKKKPPVSHPIFLTHPITGKKVLYANPGYAIRINELPEHESEETLAFQTLADQVRRCVRSVRGNQWMFRVGHPADHPLRLRPELLRRSGDGPFPVLRETQPKKGGLAQ